MSLFWVSVLNNKRSGLDGLLFHLPGPSIFPKGHLCGSSEIRLGAPPRVFFVLQNNNNNDNCFFLEGGLNRNDDTYIYIYTYIHYIEYTCPWIHVTVVQLGLTVAVHVKALSPQSAQTK